jgi:pimeloyl-ACP methyl ester carboxylesterase
VTSDGIPEERLEVLGLSTRVLQSRADGEEAIVCLHGGPGSANDWDYLLPRLARLGRTVAFDLPGFGQADKPAYLGYSALSWSAFVAGVLERLGVRRVHLVATDLGGEAGLCWGVGHPQAFASASLLNTGVLIGYSWHLVGKLHRIPLSGEIAALGGGLGLRPIMRLYEPKLPRSVITRWRREYDLGTRRAMLRFYRSAPSTAMGRIAPELRALDRPAIILWGAENRFVPAVQAERQRESFPSAEVAVLDGLGHYAHLQAPDRVEERLLPFLRTRLLSSAAVGAPPR